MKIKNINIPTLGIIKTVLSFLGVAIAFISLYLFLMLGYSLGMTM